MERVSKNLTSRVENGSEGKTVWKLLTACRGNIYTVKYSIHPSGIVRADVGFINRYGRGAYSRFRGDANRYFLAGGVYARASSSLNVLV